MGIQGRRWIGLQAASRTTPDRAALDSVRDLIDRIEIAAESEEYAAPVRISLYGKLEAFLSPAERWGSMVPRAGVEPALVSDPVFEPGASNHSSFVSCRLFGV